MRRRRQSPVSDPLARVALTQLFENIVPTSVSAQANYASVTAVGGTAGPVTVTAPLVTARSPKDTFHFAVVDDDGGAAARPITINGNGKNINGSPTLVLSVAFSGAILLYSTQLGEWVAFEFGPAVATPPSPIVLARGWADNAALVPLPAVTPTIVVSKSITPTATGKVRVTITGIVENSADPGTNSTLNVGISHGLLATPLDYVQGPGGFGITVLGTDLVTFALTVDLDAIAVPVVFPVGTPVQINAVLAAGANPLSVTAHACELSLQELSP